MYEMLVEKLRLNCAARELWLPLVPQYAEQINLLNEAADAIEELQTYADLYKDIAAENQRVARKVIDGYPKWIPVTERLPKEEETVLTWGKENKCILLDWMYDNKWCCVGNVTYWMPLPTPPKEET